jgi:AbrB family looped-hinge helix DNA binding protein
VTDGPAPRCAAVTSLASFPIAIPPSRETTTLSRQHRSPPDGARRVITERRSAFSSQLWRPEHPSAPKIFDAATTTLSSKGQVVIPEAIRERLGLKTGAQFVVVADRDVVILKVLEPPAVSEFKITYDRALWNEPASLRFIDAHAHVAIVGPVGVGKTFLAHALGWIACRRGASALCVAADKMLKALWPTRLDHTYEQAAAATPTRSSTSGTARDRSSSPRIGAPTSGSRLSPIRCVRSPPSTASSRTPTTWSSTVKATASARSHRWTRQRRQGRRQNQAGDGSTTNTSRRVGAAAPGGMLVRIHGGILLRIHSCRSNLAGTASADSAHVSSRGRSSTRHVVAERSAPPSCNRRSAARAPRCDPKDLRGRLSSWAIQPGTLLWQGATGWCVCRGSAMSDRLAQHVRTAIDALINATAHTYAGRIGT